MHKQAYDYVADAVKKYGPFESVLELGSQDMNGSVKPLFKDSVSYIGLDVAEGSGVDVVFDPDDPWIPSPKVDAVVCCEVLEHVEEWYRVLYHAYECLKPGGRLILTCAGPDRKVHSGVTGKRQLEPGEHYRNVHPEALEVALKMAGFNEVNTSYVPHDTRATAVKC